MAESEIAAVAGILVDLGISSYQLDTLERGFSFRAKSAGGPEIGPEIGPEADLAVKSDIQLDMRMDRSVGVTAADLVNRLSEQELADLIYKFGEERASRRIARRIVQERAAAPIQKTVELAELVVRAVNQKGYWKIHPATKTFQALRIAVNRELEGLDSFVATAVDLLEPEGRLVMITFHSLEDREIKQAFRFQAGQCQCPPTRPRCECGAVRRVELLTRKALRPGDVEISANPRARSAKLRACRKLAVV
jgi:16S rRNA (cytosine1402-N4)-methyltransferase